MILAFYGASGLGAELCTLAKRINRDTPRWEKMIYVDDTPEKNGTKLVGLDVMPLDKATEIYGKENLEFIVSIGEPAGKDKVYKKLKDNGYTVTNLIHPEAPPQESSQIGEGIVIYRFSAVPPLSVFGNNILIQTSTCLGHHMTLGDNVVISSFSFIGGGVQIGRNTYIGPHACLRDGIKIGENAIVGMGSVVTKDVPDNAVVYGNPAKVMRYNDTGSVFNK